MLLAKGDICMRHWIKRLFAIAAPLLLTGCLWGPGKFASDLTLRRNGSFVLDYRGEMVLQLPPDEASKVAPWTPKIAHCFSNAPAANDPIPPPILGVGDEKLEAPK